MNLEVIWHDGKTSRAYEASLDFNETGFVRLSADNISLRYALSDIRSTEPVGKLKPKIYFPDGSSCELSDLSAIHPYLPKSSRLFEFIHRCESKFIYAVGVAVLSVGIFSFLPFATMSAKTCAEVIQYSAVAKSFRPFFLKYFLT